MRVSVAARARATRARFVPAIVVLALTSCATPQTQMPEVQSVAAELEAKRQRELVVESFVEARDRLDRVAWPLVTENVELCRGNVSRRVGMRLWSNANVEDEWKEALRSRYGLSDLVQVAYIVPGSPADAVGLAAGDVLIAMNDWNVPIGDDAEVQTNDQLRAYLDDRQPIAFDVKRDGASLRMTATPRPACDYAFVVENDDGKNAYADGKRVVVFTGMMDFFRSDDELALVLSHELAHNAMGHIRAKQQNAIVGGLLGILVDVAAAAAGVNTQGKFSELGSQIGAASYSVEFEQEADYVGLYMMRRAGYTVDDAPDFWRRMAVANPKSIALKTSHPTAPERFVALEKTIEEIESKATGGRPLVPAMKPASESTPSDVVADEPGQ